MKLNLDSAHLTGSAGPWMHRLAADVSEAYDALRAIEHAAHGHTLSAVVRFIRGRKANTRTGCFDEFAAALQFPPYFGANWDAFSDCLGDLAWLRADAVVVGILDCGAFLQSAPREQLETFRQVAEAAARHIGERPHRAGRPRSLHFVLQATPEDAEAAFARWQQVNARLA